MVALSIHFDSSHTVFDNSGREYLTRYSSDPTPLRYLFCRNFEIFIPVSCLRKIPLCAVARLLKVVIDFTSSLNYLVLIAIRHG